MKAVNELNEAFNLSEVVEKSLSNRKVRRSELMMRIAGIEEYAREKRHIGVLFTLTCPNRMHSALSKSGRRIPKYDNTTPIEAQSNLNNLWARIRAKFNRDEIRVYGVRVVESHHDLWCW